jgi:hypothetical protein
MTGIVVELVCQGCGVTTQAIAGHRHEALVPCACGARRQVVRVLSKRSKLVRTAREDRAAPAARGFGYA